MQLHSLRLPLRLLSIFLAILAAGRGGMARADDAGGIDYGKADPSAPRAIQTSHESEDFREHNWLTGDATVGFMMLEDKSTLTYRLRLDSNPAGRFWLGTRLRMTGAVDKFDATVGVALTSYYGDGSEGFNIKTSETRSTITAEHFETSTLERNALVLAAGARGFLATSWDPGHESNFVPDHAKMYYAGELGLQYHNDSGLGAHRVYEAFLLASKAGVGEELAVHSAFGFLPWLVLGAEFGHMKLADALTNTYLLIEIGGSFGS